MTRPRYRRLDRPRRPLPVGFEARRPVYEAVALLWTAAFFDEWAPDADEPTGELAAWVRAEMHRRLARA